MWLMTEPPRWDIPNVSPIVTLNPLRTSMFARTREAMTFPWPPTPVITIL
jgi:hypothetical protein